MYDDDATAALLLLSKYHPNESVKKKAIDKLVESYTSYGKLKCLLNLLTTSDFPSEMKDYIIQKTIQSFVDLGYFDHLKYLSQNEEFPNKIRKKAEENILPAFENYLEWLVNERRGLDVINYMIDVSLPHNLRLAAAEEFSKLDEVNIPRMNLESIIQSEILPNSVKHEIYNKLIQSLVNKGDYDYLLYLSQDEELPNKIRKKAEENILPAFENYIKICVLDENYTLDGLTSFLLNDSVPLSVRIKAIGEAVNLFVQGGEYEYMLSLLQNEKLPKEIKEKVEENILPTLEVYVEYNSPSSRRSISAFKSIVLSECYPKYIREKAAEKLFDHYSHKNISVVRNFSKDKILPQYIRDLASEKVIEFSFNNKRDIKLRNIVIDSEFPMYTREHALEKLILLYTEKDEKYHLFIKLLTNYEIPHNLIKKAVEEIVGYYMRNNKYSIMYKLMNDEGLSSEIKKEFESEISTLVHTLEMKFLQSE